MSISSVFSFPVLGATVNDDQLVASDEEFVAFDALLANEIASSTVRVQLVGLSHYRYEAVRMSTEQIRNLTFPLHDIQRRDVKDLVATMPALGFDYHIVMITAMWPVECKPTDSSMEDSIREEGD